MQQILFVFMQSLNFVMFYYLVLHSASRYPLYYINPKHSCTSTIKSTPPHPLMFSGEPLCTTNCRQGRSFFQPLSCCLLFHFCPIVALALLNATTYLTVPKLTAIHRKPPRVLQKNKQYVSTSQSFFGNSTCTI